MAASCSSTCETRRERAQKSAPAAADPGDALPTAAALGPPCEPGPACTWHKYNAIARAVERLSIRQKREIFRIMRLGDSVNEHTFLPSYGFTVGEFSVFHTLQESGRKESGRAAPSIAYGTTAGTP
jgi:hypothetical protein